MTRPPSGPGTGWIERLPSGRARACIRIGGRVVKSRSYAKESMVREAMRLLQQRKVLEDTGMLRTVGLLPRATVGDAVDAYLERLNRSGDRYSPRTRERYGELMDEVRARFGRIELARLNEAEVERWDGEMASAGRSVGSRLLALGALSWCVDLAVELRWLPAPPCNIPRPTKRVETPRTALPEADLARLLDAAPPGSVARRVILLAADSGLRRDEIWALRWEDVRDGWLHVTGKGRKRRMVPILTSRLAAELANRQHPDARVCPVGPSGRDVAQAVRQLWRKTLGVREPNLHRLRHRFSSMAQACGAPVASVRDWLGHQSVATTDTYLHSPAPPAGLGAALERATGATTGRDEAADVPRETGVSRVGD